MSKQENRAGSSDLPGQMALELPSARSFSRDDLIVAEANSLAVEIMEAWPDWPGNVVILAGPVGSGKSHIASLWAKTANAITVDIAQLGKLGEDRDNERSLLLENADGTTIDETVLFHVLNAKRNSGGSVVIASRTWPSEWGLTLPDLASRMRAAQLVELGEPDDELLRAVLFKLFSDRQLQIEPTLVDYLVTRMERSLESADQIVRQLDKRSLEKSRKITKQLANEVLQIREMGTR